MKKILILGGGFAGIEFYRTLHARLHTTPRALFQLVSRHNYFLFYPMLHEVATGSVERAHITQPLREIVNCCVETFTQAEVTRIDFAARRVETSVGALGYDYLVIALGVRAHFFGVTGADVHCVPFKSVEDAVTVRNHTLWHFELATRTHDVKERRALLSFVIVGGGAVGVELAGQLADLTQHELVDLYQEVDPQDISITVVEAGDRLLKQFHPDVGMRAQEQLERMGVKIILNARVSSCANDGVLLESGQHIRGALRVWSAGTTSLLRGIIAPEFLTNHGALKVEDTLQLVGHPEVFAIGDNAEIVSPHAQFVPQTAQAAAAQARTAARNLERLLDHQPPAAFHFRSLGDIVPIGDWYAVGQVDDIRIRGRLVWAMRRLVFLKRIWSPMNRVKIFVDWVLHSIMRRDTSEL